MNVEAICNDIYELAKEIYSELGGGFNETVLQNALAIELRENGINYLKEVNIEIFYKGHSIGTDRPDFILLSTRKRSWELNEPMVLETKVSDKIRKEHRQQLKSYFKSFPHNKNPVVQKINKGILLNFLKTEELLSEEETKPEIMVEFWFYSQKTGKMKLKYEVPTA